MPLSLDWANRTDLQKIAFIVSVVVVLGAALCIASNIAVAVEGDKNNWFRDQLRQRILFFVNRVFAILFSLLVMVAEFHSLLFVSTYCLAFRYFFVRGGLQCFVGIMTVSGDFAPPGDGTAAAALAAIGWVLVGVGLLHFVLSVCCFKEYSAALEEGDANNMAPGVVLPPTQAVPANIEMTPASGAAPSNTYPTAGGTNDGASYRI